MRSSLSDPGILGAQIILIPRENILWKCPFVVRSLMEDVATAWELMSLLSLADKCRKLRNCQGQALLWRAVGFFFFFFLNQQC